MARDLSRGAVSLGELRQWVSRLNQSRGRADYDFFEEKDGACVAQQGHYRLACHDSRYFVEMIDGDVLTVVSPDDMTRAELIAWLRGCVFGPSR